jgi:hypothetical protein
VSIDPAIASPVLGMAAMMAILAVPVRYREQLHGWRLSVWGGVATIVTLVVLAPLMPDVDAARPLLATIAVGLGLPLCTVLALGVAERWRWRYLAPLGAAVAVCVALPIILLPAHATEGLTATTTTAAPSILPPELSGVPIPSWLTTLLAGAALARYCGGLIGKGVTIRLVVDHSFDSRTPRVEIHHPGPTTSPPADDPTEERSGVRRAPRR